MASRFQSSAQIALIRSLIDRRERFGPNAGLPGSTRVERGAVLADFLCGEPFRVEPIDPSVPVVDALGHTRPMYRGLVEFCIGLATPKSRVTPNPVSKFEFVGSNPARHGARIAGETWTALARRDFDFIRSVVANQSGDGSFLTPNPSDNPETFWYHDLILLHAVDAYADLSGDSEAAAAVENAAVYHQQQTQSDHATAEPWGLSAFVKFSATVGAADGLLHAVQANQPNGPRGVTLLLLADTLYRFGLGGKPL